MATVRRRPSKTKQTARAKKSLTEKRQKSHAKSVGKCCNECIAKLKAHHANRTAEGEAKFVAMLVDVLSFAASKQATSVRRSLNSLSYKGKVRLKDTSEAELTRFAQAAYADSKFMDHYKSTGKIVMHLLIAVILGGVVACKTAYMPYDVLSQYLELKQDDSKAKVLSSIIFALLSAGFGYLFGGTAFRKNITRLRTIIKKY